jgi:hypothetical protein
MLRIVLIVAALAGCATQPDDRPARWSYLATTIVEPSCAKASCHSSLARTAGVVLDDRASGYRSLTQVPDPSTARPYVEPEDAAACNGTQPFRSRLHYLLRGDATIRMPPDAPLPVEDVELIERWMCSGAKDD